MANKNIPKRTEFIITTGTAIALYGFSVLKKAISRKSKEKIKKDKK